MTRGMEPDRVDLIFTGGAVHLVDGGNHIAEALAVAGDRILFAGSDADVRAYARRAARAWTKSVSANVRTAGSGHALTRSTRAPASWSERVSQSFDSFQPIVVSSDTTRTSTLSPIRPAAGRGATCPRRR